MNINCSFSGHIHPGGGSQNYRDERDEREQRQDDEQDEQDEQRHNRAGRNHHNRQQYGRGRCYTQIRDVGWEGGDEWSLVHVSNELANKTVCKQIWYIQVFIYISLQRTRAWWRRVRSRSRRPSWPRRRPPTPDCLRQIPGCPRQPDKRPRPQQTAWRKQKRVSTTIY